MNRPHDIGGETGHGPIDVAAPEFAHDWERRMWALSKNTGASAGTIDWWRCVLEQLPPEVYRTIPYFEKWCLTAMVTFISAGDFTPAEAVSGRSEHRQSPPAPSGIPGALERLRANEVSFSRPIEAKPAFALSEAVRTVPHITARHTRLPRYAQGCMGRVLAHHGGHVFADASARGESEVQHLYTIEFDATELWGDAADARDSVTLDLWESYLVRP